MNQKPSDKGNQGLFADFVTDEHRSIGGFTRSDKTTKKTKSKMSNKELAKSLNSQRTVVKCTLQISLLLVQGILNVIGGLNSHCLCLISNCLLIATGVIYHILAIIDTQYGEKQKPGKTTIIGYLLAILAQVAGGFVLSGVGIKEFLNLQTKDDGKDGNLILFVGSSYMICSLICILLETYYTWESEESDSQSIGQYSDCANLNSDIQHSMQKDKEETQSLLHNEEDKDALDFPKDEQRLSVDLKQSHQQTNLETLYDKQQISAYLHKVLKDQEASSDAQQYNIDLSVHSQAGAPLDTRTLQRGTRRSTWQQGKASNGVKSQDGAVLEKEHFDLNQEAILAILYANFMNAMMIFVCSVLIYSSKEAIVLLEPLACQLTQLVVLVEAIFVFKYCVQVLFTQCEAVESKYAEIQDACAHCECYEF